MIECPFGQRGGGGILGMVQRGGPEAAADGQVLVLGRLGQEQAFISSSFSGISCRQVVRLAPVFVDVVQLPCVGQRRPLADARWNAADPWFSRSSSAHANQPFW